MRTTIVPAQITTVEDRIAGRLGLSQLMLLIAPVFGGSGIFVILPPFFNYAVYKLVVIVCFAVLCGLLAVRIKGKILLFWAIVLVSYNARPMYYVFDKNDTYARNMSRSVGVDEVVEEAKSKELDHGQLPQLSTADLVKVEGVLTNPATNLHFITNKKGELYVRLTEVQQESLITPTN